jgi:hypothetical protein
MTHEGDDRGTKDEFATATSGALWTPPPSLRFSLSKVKPCLTQTLLAMSVSIVWLPEAKMPISIRSFMIWNGLLPMAVARSFTVNGGLRWMIFSSETAAGAAGMATGSGSGSGAAGAGADSSATGSTTGADAGAGFGVSGPRIREIIGMRSLLSSSDCVRVRLVFAFGSMSETVSFTTFGAGGSAGAGAFV